MKVAKYAQELIDIYRAEHLYDRSMENVQRVYNESWTQRNLKKSNIHLKDVVERLHPNSILEVGCGNGRHLRFLKQFFPDIKYAGIDLSSTGIEQARKNNGDIDFFCCSAESLPFAGNSFDMILTYHALEQMVVILNIAILEICRVSQKWVVCFESFLRFQNFFGRLHNMRLGYARYIPEMFVHNGLKVIEFRDLHYGSPVNKTGLMIASRGETLG